MPDSGKRSGIKSSSISCKPGLNGVKETWTLTMVCCGFHAPDVAKLKAVVNVLQRTYFKT